MRGRDRGSVVQNVLRRKGRETGLRVAGRGPRMERLSRLRIRESKENKGWVVGVDLRLRVGDK